MDMPWPVYMAHVTEHFLALGRLHLLHMVDQFDQLGRMAEANGRRGQTQLHQLAALCAALLSGVTAGVLFCRGLLAISRAFTSLAVSLFLCSGRMIQAAMPHLTALGLILYTNRLLKSSALRQEWLDFWQQWIWSRQLLSFLGFDVANVQNVDCPICANSLEDNPWCLAKLPCCKKSICWECVWSHAESVIDDARPQMSCPMLCSRSTVLPDVLVIASLRRRQWSWKGLDVLGRQTRRKKRAYERWCLSSGLASSCAARMEDVIHCPGSECSHMWVLPKALRRSKSAQEPGSRWDPRAWSLGRHVGLYAPPTEDGRDGRRVSCPSCKIDYCILCSQAWEMHGRTHEGKSCLEFDAALPEAQRSKDRHWAGAKACPGCGVRTLRTMGCNHMTCTQCSMHWCWVCGKPWQPWHYGCTPNTQPTGDCSVDRKSVV